MPSALRKACDSRLSSLRAQRDGRGWYAHWGELANNILPRKYLWVVTPNDPTRGNPMNGNIFDSTPTLAARDLAAGMMAGITSPSRPWFKLGIQGMDLSETSPGAIWLEEVERRMMLVFQESNFYGAMAAAFSDLAVFNTAPILIYEDFEDVIRCYNPSCGEYFLGLSARMDVNIFYREFARTVAQIVEEFGEDRVPQNIKMLYDQKDNRSLETEFLVCHAIEPNSPYCPEVPRHFKYRDLYWIKGSVEEDERKDFLKIKGFFDIPGVFLRWDVVGNDAYGCGPSMYALGDIKQLQQETKRKGQALDKSVNPPLRADVQMKNQPMSLIPGGVTFVTNMSTSKGVEPVYEVAPPIAEITQDIAFIQQRIQRIFHNDLFMMFQQLQAEPRSAAAVDARREEKVVMLGPVLERIQGEGLDKIIDRTFNIMQRAGLIPPAPEDIRDKEIKIDYISILAEAQKAVAVGGIERLAAFAGSLSAVKPDTMDKINLDQAIDEMADKLSVSAKIVRSDDEVLAMRETRAKRQAQIDQMAVTDAAVNAGKTLSETEVGGGMNALEAMLQ